MFLLSSERSLINCAHALAEGRNEYTERRDHFLKFIQHPEALNELTVDPLADDPEVRHDLLLLSREEIN